MDLLLDTCALILFLEDDPRLPGRLSAKLEDPANRCHVSLASLWEIAIKASLGKLRAAYANRADFPELLRANGFTLISPDWHAMQRAAFLPQHHRDPFDRLLVAEAQLRGWPLVSCDDKLDLYGVTRIWR